MLLPSGAYCLIREKSLTDRGYLLLIGHHWLSPADQAANPQHPRAAHDHTFQPPKNLVTGEHVAVTAEHKLLPHILAALDQAIVGGKGQIAINPDVRRGTADPFALLKHPDIASIEVTTE
jgi:hypothetical protein